MAKQTIHADDYENDDDDDDDYEIIRAHSNY
jgi:hypothetical protein